MKWLKTILAPFRKTKRPKLVVSHDAAQSSSKVSQTNSLNLRPGQRIEIFRMDQIPVVHDGTTISVFQHYSIKEKVMAQVVEVIPSENHITVRLQNPRQGAMVATFRQGQKARIIS